MRKLLLKISVSLVLALSLVPACPAYAADAEDWASLEGWLSSINGKLGYLYADTTTIIEKLTDLVEDGINVTVDNSTVVARLNTVITRLVEIDGTLDMYAFLFHDTTYSGSTTIYGYVQQIKSLLSLLYSDFQDLPSDIATALGDSITVNVPPTDLSDVQQIKNVLSLLYSDFQDLPSDIANALGDSITVNVQPTDLSDVLDELGNIESLLASIERQAIAILGKMVIPSSSDVTDIIGDFDAVGFQDNVDDLVGDLSGVAPFGAVFLISSQMNLLATVQPPAEPVLYWDFDFFGDNTVAIDLSWLDDIKPVLNFTTLFLLMYCLGIVSFKFVRNEATS